MAHNQTSPGIVNSQIMNQPVAGQTVIGQTMNGKITGQNYTMLPQFIQPGSYFIGQSPKSMGQMQVQNQVQTPNTPLAQQSPASIDPFSLLLQRLDSVDTKVTHLDSINQTVNRLDKRLNGIEKKVEEFEKRLTQLEESRQFDSNVVENLSGRQSKIEELTNRLKSLETEKQSSEEYLNTYRRDELKNNLLFFKIEDSQDETTNDCRRAIDDVIEHKMKVEDAKERLKIQSVERLGRFKKWCYKTSSC